MQKTLDVVFKQLGSAVLGEYAEWVLSGQASDAIKKLYNGKTFITGGTDGGKIMFAWGAEFVEVRVHTRTREIRVPRAVGAFAAGRLYECAYRSQPMLPSPAPYITPPVPISESVRAGSTRGYNTMEFSRCFSPPSTIPSPTSSGPASQPRATA